MTASKRATRHSSPDPAIGSDLAKVDAHIVQPHEYDDLPELTDELMGAAEIRQDGKLIRRGRPPAMSPKKLVSVRLDQDVLDRFRATGPGWQTRMNEALRRYLDAQAA